MQQLTLSHTSVVTHALVVVAGHAADPERAARLVRGGEPQGAHRPHGQLRRVQPRPEVGVEVHQHQAHPRHVPAVLGSGHPLGKEGVGGRVGRGRQRTGGKK